MESDVHSRLLLPGLSKTTCGLVSAQIFGKIKRVLFKTDSGFSSLAECVLGGGGMRHIEGQGCRSGLGSPESCLAQGYSRRPGGAGRTMSWSAGAELG